MEWTNWTENLTHWTQGTRDKSQIDKAKAEYTMRQSSDKINIY